MNNILLSICLWPLSGIIFYALFDKNVRKNLLLSMLLGPLIYIYIYQIRRTIKIKQMIKIMKIMNVY